MNVVGASVQACRFDLTLEATAILLFQVDVPSKNNKIEITCRVFFLSVTCTKAARVFQVTTTAFGS